MTLTTLGNNSRGTYADDFMNLLLPVRVNNHGTGFLKVKGRRDSVKDGGGRGTDEFRYDIVRQELSEKYRMILHGSAIKVLSGLTDVCVPCSMLLLSVATVKPSR